MGEVGRGIAAANVRVTEVCRAGHRNSCPAPTTTRGTSPALIPCRPSQSPCPVTITTIGGAPQPVWPSALAHRVSTVTRPPGLPVRLSSSISITHHKVGAGRGSCPVPLQPRDTMERAAGGGAVVGGRPRPIVAAARVDIRKVERPAAVTTEPCSTIPTPSVCPTPTPPTTAVDASTHTALPHRDQDQATPTPRNEVEASLAKTNLADGPHPGEEEGRAGDKTAAAAVAVVASMNGREEGEAERGGRRKEPLLRRSLFRTKSGEEKRGGAAAIYRTRTSEVKRPSGAFSPLHESSVYAFELEEARPEDALPFSQRIRNIQPSPSTSPAASPAKPTAATTTATLTTAANTTNAAATTAKPVPPVPQQPPARTPVPGMRSPVVRSLAPLIVGRPRPSVGVLPQPLAVGKKTTTTTATGTTTTGTGTQPILASRAAGPTVPDNTTMPPKGATKTTKSPPTTPQEGTRVGAESEDKEAGSSGKNGSSSSSGSGSCGGKNGGRRNVSSASIAIQCDMDEGVAAAAAEEGGVRANESGTQTDGPAKFPLPPNASPFYYLPLAMAALGEKLPAQLVQQMLAKTQGLVGAAEAGMILQQAAQLAQQHQQKLQQGLAAPPPNTAAVKPIKPPITPLVSTNTTTTAAAVRPPPKPQECVAAAAATTCCPTTTNTTTTTIIGTVPTPSTTTATTTTATTTTALTTTATLTTTVPSSTTTTATTVTTQPSITTTTATTTMTVTTPPCTSASPTVPVLPTQTSTTTITTSITTATITTTTTSLVSASKNAKPVHVPSHRHHTTATPTTTTTTTAAITTTAAAVTQEPESDGAVRGKPGRGRARQEGRGQEEEQPPTRRRSGRATTLASTRATESDLQEIEELRRSRRAKRAAVALAKEEGWSSSSEAPLSPQMSPDTLRGWPPPRLTSPTPSQSSEGTTSSTPSQRSNRLSSRSRRQSPASTFDFSMSASRSSAPSTPASQSSLGTGGASGSLADKTLADPNAGYTCDNSILTRAPSFFPSEEEFTDPLDYIEKIRPEAEQFGLCRIVPPSNFKPECRVNDDMRFTGNNQYVQKMMHRWGPNVRTLRAIRRCLAKQNIELTTNPLIGCMELDLVRLYEVVEQHGGLMSVIENELWGKVADACRIPRSAQERITKLDSIYCKYLLPYATLSSKEREELLAEVDTIHSRNMGESGAKKPSSAASSDNEEEEEEESLDCIVKGKSTALSTFYRIARNTASQWQPDPASLEVDERYWSLVSNGSHHVCVLSASIDTSEHGYGFPSHRSSPLAKHPWNLKNLCQNPNSILKSMGTIVGVTAPTLHVGMLFSTVCWYKDPHSLPWIEYLHTGASKIWYGVAASQEGKLCAALKKMVPDFVKDSAIWLPSDTAMVPPSELVREGVRVCRVVQDPGQFVVVFPGAFTSSVCKGYLISESAFFARPQYFDRAVATFKALRDCCEPSMFSLERLVLSVVTDPRSTLDGLLRARELVLQVVQREKDLRARLAQIGLEASERLSTPDSHRKKKSRFIEDEEENMCEMCRQNLYVALVTNSQEEAVYCLEHALTFLNKNPDHLEYCKLMYTYSLSELDGAVKQMEERILLKSGKKTSPIGKKNRQREHLDSFSSTSSSNL